MEKEILRSNKIPGCDQLTRPEEIKSLSKYLNHVKKVQEEHTTVQENVLEIPGITTGKFPNVENLVSDLISLDDSRNNELENTIIGLNDFRNNKLEDTIINLDDSKDNELENTIVSLDDFRNNELENTIVSLDDFRNNELENTIVSLDDSRDSELDDTIVSLDDSRDSELDDTIVSLDDSRNNELEDIVINLDDSRNNELEDTVINLDDSRNNELEDTIIEIDDSRNNKLEDTIINLDGSRDNELENTIVSLDDSRDNELEDTIIEIDDSRNNELEDTIIEIDDSRDNELENTVISLDDSRNNKLEDTIINLDDSRDNELENTIVSLNDSRNNELEDTIIEIDDSRNNELEDTIIEIDDSRNNELEDTIIEIDDSRDNELEEGIEELTKAQSSEFQDDYNYFDTNIGGGELYDSVIGLRNSEGPKNDSEYDFMYSESSKLENELIELDVLNPDVDSLNDEFFKLKNTDDFNTVELKSTITKLVDTKEKLSSDTDDKLLKLNNTENFKVTELDPTNIKFTDLINFDDFEISELEQNNIGAIENTAKGYPNYKLPNFNLDLINPSAYLRWTAEQLVGQWVHGETRQLLLDEALVTLTEERLELEKKLGSNRGRLPGNDDGGLLGDVLSGGVKQALNNSMSRIAGAVNPSTNLPMNRPDGNPVTGWEGANIEASNSKSIVDSVILGDSTTKEKRYKFSPNYLKGEGIKSTIEDLCVGKVVTDLGSVEDLFDALRSSPFITTPGKFMTTEKEGSKYTTLDSNAHWEIILEPYVGSLNGEWSFLPDPREINTRNRIIHGVTTDYNKWIPFTSFELQKSKMTSKSINLYDGEIMFPVSMEFINELRFTISDDQYKSWRMYFEDCAKVAIYNSEPHEKSYYSESSNLSQIDNVIDGNSFMRDYFNVNKSSPHASTSLTAIDKNNVCIAMYKNITFRCLIYVMNPQLSTIKKYDLLLVLRDFTEESSGEIESGGSDLSVIFSIVGESPEDQFTKPSTELKLTPLVEKSRKSDLTTILTTAGDSVIKLIT